MKRLFSKFRALPVSLSLKFIIGVVVVISIALGISAYFILKKDRDLIMEQLKMQAEALFSEILLTRRWIADHGGVFIWSPGQRPNPLLLEPEIVDTKGRTFIKMSPAMVTKALSEYAREEGSYWFHITSLKLVNPENAPDAFERAALLRFERDGLKEFSDIERVGNSYIYRYIAPLYVEKPCLRCHAFQGYKLGDVRGAISVFIPMNRALSMVRSERKTIIVASVATICTLILSLYLMMKELVLRPVKQLRSSMQDFSRDRKAKTPIIRTGDELEELSKSFDEMASSLKEYHYKLEDKIHIATKGLEEANRRLRQSNERKSDFIAKISHELRNPMTSMKGAMDYIAVRISRLSKDNGAMDDITEFLGVIKKNADRLIRMVNDTLDLERIEAGMIDLQTRQMEIVSLIKEVTVSFNALASEKGVTFRMNAPASVFVVADEDRMRQVMENLISNAIKFSPQHSEVTIIVSKETERVSVSISDEGPGVSPRDQKRIFEKFYTKSGGDGTGLGLAICKGIIEAHGGEIGVSVKGQGRGSTFYFHLPGVDHP
jgi:signal transduction histidine kinase